MQGARVFEAGLQLQPCHGDQRQPRRGAQAFCGGATVRPDQPPAPSLMPPNQRVTTTITRSKPCPSIAARIGRPAVPAGSPSSLER